jgi:TPP-dependent pyruvate/acetoin dehydrogenase alpha subunit
MLGDLIPVMTGVAMAGRYLGQNIVALTWIGDGGTSTGAFHEGMNLAAQQRASLVLVVENNLWAYSTPVHRQVPVTDLADRAKAYGSRAFIVDGNDVEAVFVTAREAVRLCRAGEGPVLIEAKTMRMRGHAQHDPADYVPKEMFEFWKRRDPIVTYEKRLMESGVLSEKKKAEILEHINQVVKEDVEFAENSPFPPPELAESSIYCEGPLPIEPEWKRPVEEVTPPRCSVTAEWSVPESPNGHPKITEGASPPVAEPAAGAKPARDGAGRQAAGRHSAGNDGAKKAAQRGAKRPVKSAAPARGRK